MCVCVSPGLCAALRCVCVCVCVCVSPGFCAALRCVCVFHLGSVLL